MDAELIQNLLPVALTHLLAFIIFIFLLQRLAVGPILRLLDERREKIASQFDDIDVSEKRVASLREEYEKKLQEIDEEARKRTLEEVNRGKRIAEEIAENARSEASGIIESAKANIQIQIDKARSELKDEIVSLALAASERLIRERLDEEKQRELVGRFITELEEKEER
ncbi:F0F1 ATP synthase subunit B [bacterium]|nr:F0F1 ATP synthase subunit B [bacterium]